MGKLEKKDRRTVMALNLIAAFIVCIYFVYSLPQFYLLYIPKFIGMNFILIIYMLVTFILKKKINLTVWIIVLWSSVALSYYGNNSKFKDQSQEISLENFTEAFAEEGKIHNIIGTINKDIPVKTLQANLVVFNMIDEQGKEVKVFLNQTVYENFDRSDKLVVKGKADVEKNAFFATEYVIYN
tara:strand:- start:1346 stop:1894 length:549 start_codon:yes stop_codon:yes gene_type:complete